MGPARLNVFQRLVRTWEEVHPYNAAQAIKLKGICPLTTARQGWQAALAATGLGCVRVRGREYSFETPLGDAAAFEVECVPPHRGLDRHFSEGLNAPFNRSQELPFRPFLLQETEAFYLGLVYQHWVADSVSIRRLMREWLLRVDHPGLARHVPLRLAGGYWERFGAGRGDLRIGQTALTLFRNHMRFRRVLKVETCGPTHYEMRVCLHEMPPGFIPSLVQACRRSAISVGDVLLAALAEACAQHVPVQRRGKRTDWAVAKIVDLRPYARHRLEDTFGLLLGFSTVFCRPADLASWPRLLNTVRRQGRPSRSAAVAHVSGAWMQAAVMMRPLVPPHRLYGFYRKETPLAGGLSNVNLRNEWPSALYPDPVLDYIRVAPGGPMAPLVVSTTTLGDRFNFALTYRPALMDDATAAAFAATFSRRLREAVL